MDRFSSRPETENEAKDVGLHSANQSSSRGTEINVLKRLIADADTEGVAPDSEVFTLALADETIELLPFKSWAQLDRHKWTARGKLPTEPPGLEIAPDHVKIMGQTVAIADPAGCAKLKQLFSDWLKREEQESVRRRTHQPLSAPSAVSHPTPSQTRRFIVEVDKRGQVHIHFMSGKEPVASIGLTVAGFNSLCQQGFLLKPRQVQIGALHDWVQLDEDFFSFEKGKNDARRLEQVLNQKYLPTTSAGAGKEVLIFLNPASSTGFDIQFPVLIAGMPHNHRHHLNTESLEQLQDPIRCGLLHHRIIVKLIPPSIVFKQKTADGGEQYLPTGTENLVNIQDSSGPLKTIDLSQPLNLLRLSAAELTAVFNHPSVNRHAQAAPTPPISGEVSTGQLQAAPAPSAEPVKFIERQTQSGPVAGTTAGQVESGSKQIGASVNQSESAPVPVGDQGGAGISKPGQGQVATPLSVVEMAEPPPNVWLKEILLQPCLRHDWLACLVYSKIAGRFANSSKGRLGPLTCWFVCLTDCDDPEASDFKGIFLTEKGGLGYLDQGFMARFNNGVAFIGPPDSPLEGVRVQLLAVGLDAGDRFVFVVNDEYRANFGVPSTALDEMLNRMAARGALLWSIPETLASRVRLEVVWTAPAAQPNPNDPQAIEHIRPAA